ncbi:hypothetical protein CBQ28_23635 [Pseudoalteromonas sp. GCY]|uniref:sigma-54-dependent Fis family transcriptional regulator n=1 Tax=Pseudoalteromonas sp. GCY TaxID=2003316 RepID=UPI000BFECE53|nr:sigma-54-dependent Fis family transcriptional regulator [Pseudoalteromonas sp. GCY]PHI34655.1 hypothetical protein CBQ28_23635 [Pseudoalteromonas sp. GCY]QQQ66030.1 sigma-54-dependent Fis family transcriptional regulator [Pseudoalteromonas sp. GCY]
MLHNDKLKLLASEKQINLAWERFVSAGSSPHSSIRTVVADSWQRCLHDGVDPTLNQTSQYINESDFQLLLTNNEQLIKAAKPAMRKVGKLLAESGSMLILADKQGVCLHVEGDEKTLEAGREIKLHPSAIWSESAAGTNAIGTVLAVGSQVQINTTEHFCEGIKLWTCTAVVIREPISREVIGVLDLSGLNHEFSYHARALVADTAARIENQLLSLKLEQHNTLFNAALANYSDTTKNGLLLLDKEGGVIKESRQFGANLAQHAIPFSLTDLSSVDAEGGLLKQLRNLFPEKWMQPIFAGDELLGTLLVVPPAKKVIHRADLSASNNGSSFTHIIGNAPALTKVINKAQRLSRLDIPVLIQGETGVGKELFARAIHASSGFNQGPLVTLNCGGLSRELIASELFGYAEGAFTGAVRGGKVGKIEAANGGTLFLDEIGEIPLDIQANFLRVLQEGEICRLGETKQRKLHFRVLAATNRDLSELVKQGLFRSDLFYRIATVKLYIPPLNERKSDIPQLVSAFIERLSTQSKAQVTSISPELYTLLAEYHWPGNVRELKNVIDCAYLMNSGDRLTVADLLEEFPFLATFNKKKAKQQIDSVNRAHCDPSNAETSLLTNLSLEQVEQMTVAAALKKNKGNITKAALQLGIAKSTLYQKIQKFKLG